ncbi:MAG TPA: hypothetical protein VNZ53_39320 [Steroidobacteraceae bacterium]|nr:hypothetical protein [Steroidobacteraceae bacterium]
MPSAEAESPYAIDNTGILSTAAFGITCSVTPVDNGVMTIGFLPFTES